MRGAWACVTASNSPIPGKTGASAPVFFVVRVVDSGLQRRRGVRRARYNRAIPAVDRVKQNLSSSYARIRQLRSRGDCSAAVSMLRSQPPSSDADAFEAVVCLFVCGQTANALHVCRTHAWKDAWALHMTQALTERFGGGNVSRALALARKGAGNRDAPCDAAALYILLLQDAGAFDEAQAYISERFQNPPLGETLLLTTIAEAALAAQDWREAYRSAAAVLATDPDDYRALLVLSAANYEIGNIHESLGNAIRASFVRKAAAPAILQIMRCQNKLGDYYAALAALDKLAQGTGITPEVHVELGTAYLGLDLRAAAIAEFGAALSSEPQRVAALRALIGIYSSHDGDKELQALITAYRADIDSDVECLYALGLDALNRGDLDGAAEWLTRSRDRAHANGSGGEELPWPVPELRLRHDCEQLELLEGRGRLDSKGRAALTTLKRYHQPGTDAHGTIAPPGHEGDALKHVLADTYYIPESTFAGKALGDNDYQAIEEAYLADGRVIIDNFLAPEALADLRRFCEEATVWKVTNPRGYVGAVLGQGFSPRVLLAAAHELRLAMPRILRHEPLLQAWGFKYDQRMQGINMHADFARVNVNFWITPDSACEDPETGGMIVWDVPVPKSWTFYQYNNESERLAAYVRVHDAKRVRVPHRANRCVLFDSSLIHITDEMHFRPGYENRRVNVTLLFGRARTIE
jgi:tetratricopeptide (TPR) repeat protein